MAQPKIRTRRFYLLMGTGWGMTMFIWREILMPFMEDDPVTLKKILISLPFWLLGGLFFGFILKKMGNQNRS